MQPTCGRARGRPGAAGRTPDGDGRCRRPALPDLEGAELPEWTGACTLRELRRLPTLGVSRVARLKVDTICAGAGLRVWLAHRPHRVGDSVRWRVTVERQVPSSRRWLVVAEYETA